MEDSVLTLVSLNLQLWGLGGAQPRVCPSPAPTSIFCLLSASLGKRNRFALGMPSVFVIAGWGVGNLF